MNRLLIFVAKSWQDEGDDDDDPDDPDDPEDDPDEDGDCRPPDERSSWMYDWSCDEMNEFDRIQTFYIRNAYVMKGI